MKRVMVILGIAAALLGSVLFPAAPSVHAADQGGAENITLTPAVNRPTLDAGQKLDGKLTVINNGESDYTFVVYARPYSVKGEQYDPNFTEVNEKTQAYQWVEFGQTEYRLTAGQRVDVPYTVNVPKNAASGGHYAVLFAETQPNESGDSSVMRKKRVGSLLYMTVNGEVRQAGTLESWDAKMWQTSKPLTSLARLKNTGNTHFQADIHAQYSDLFGRKRFELNKEVLVLPGTTRRIPVEWVDAPLLGVFKASGTVDYLGKTDTLPVHYIIFLPVNVLLATVAVLILLAVLLILKRRNNKPMRLR